MPKKLGNFACENKKIEKIRKYYVETSKEDHQAKRRS